MTVEERVKARSEFKESLQSKTKEELETLLNELLEESKNLNKEVSETTYDLPVAKQKAVFDNINYFIDKQSVKWNYALGIITIYEFFDKKQTQITYALLDTTLRMLGSLEFKGYAEWKKVVAINDYFSGIAESYREITDRILDSAERYSMVEQQLELWKSANTSVEEHN